MNETAPPYRTFVFDCDGVILNSNATKTEGFRRVASRYGEEVADALAAYHTAHGGISRFEKFRHLLAGILGREASPEDVQRLSDDYAREVGKGLLECDIALDLEALRDANPDVRWMMVSGGAEAELRGLLARRDVSRYFDAGIFGSPTTKDEIFRREIASGRLALPAVFFGDSAYDHQSSKRAGLDFVFVSGWTEFDGWRGYCRLNGIPYAGNIAEAIGLVAIKAAHHSSAGRSPSDVLRDALGDKA